MAIVAKWQGNSFVLNAIPKKIKRRPRPRIRSTDMYILYLEKPIPKGADRVGLIHLATFQFHQLKQAQANAKHLAKSLLKPVVLAVKHANGVEREIRVFRPSGPALKSSKRK